MESSKLKNIIILILVIANLGLLGFTVQREYQEARLQGRALEDAVRFLAGRGVAVDEEVLPDGPELTPQTVERDLEGESALAAQLLGPAESEAPGGEVYRYFNENGSLQFHSDGAFSGEFVPGALPVGEDAEKDCLDILSRLDFQGELIAREGDSLTFRQLWQGTPLFSQQVTLTVKDGSLTAMTAGRRLVGTPQPDPARRPVTQATALIQFLNGVTALGDVCSRVDAVTPGYVSGTALSGPVALTPVWHIATDTGAYQLDLVTGALTRAEV